MKNILLLFLAVLVSTVSCDREATIASYNVSLEADQFRVFRRVVFYNGITDTYILLVEGYCSVERDMDGDINVIVKTDNGTYIKHMLGLSDNVTWFAEQLESSKISTTHYRVVFKPSLIIPDIELK